VLTEAIIKGNAEVVKLLLAAGADITLKDNVRKKGAIVSMANPHLLKSAR
jgi:ankyrin repeat protein